MTNVIARYYHWLHGKWPAGGVERLPKVGEQGATNIRNVRIAGDLSGIPLLKMSIQSGVETVRAIQEDIGERPSELGEVVTDICIIGAGIAGVSAATEAKRLGLSYRLLDSSRMFSTIVNFPKGKPIYTYPRGMDPPGSFSVDGDTREELLANVDEQAQEQGIEAEQASATHVSREGGLVLVHHEEGEPLRARSAIIAIGRSGNFRTMDIPGEDSDRVSNRLHDPAKHADQQVCIVGGGDSACEAAISLVEAGAEVTLSYRRPELTRPKLENVEQVHRLADENRLDLRLDTQPVRVDDQGITLRRNDNGEEEEVPANQIFSLIGREPPLEFFRRSGLKIHGEYSLPTYTWLVAFFAFAALIYGMKNYGWLQGVELNPVNWAKEHTAAAQESGHTFGLWDTIVASMSNGFGFFITLLYCSAVIGFGIDRMVRRRTPYVYVQTATLMVIQCVPLFILPEILLPWMGHQGFFDGGTLGAIADELFPAVDYDANGREYWRAYGFILAWPLFVWNVFTAAPLWGWLAISLAQTFVLIPAMIYFWGKGSYCGWICSCGALAETMGDRHREKMPHGPVWNKLNMVGQVLLWIALGMLLLRGIQWATGSLSGLNGLLLVDGWKPVVDYALAGAMGVGLYFWFSGRVWCRFACPLAALMHIYTRFSRFRIVSEGHKCISCNACTSVCHQGIDIMAFANKDQDMADPECVRCSACVQTCPTGVLAFGQVDKNGEVIKLDKLTASLTRAREED